MLYLQSQIRSTYNDVAGLVFGYEERVQSLSLTLQINIGFIPKSLYTP